MLKNFLSKILKFFRGLKGSLLIAFFLIPNNFSSLLPIKAETAPDVTWSEILGDSNNYNGIVGWGVEVSTDGSIYITGQAYGNLDDQVSNNQTYNIFLTKYLDDGEKIWTRLLGSDQSDESRSVTTASDGSIYISGFTSGNLSGEGENNSNAGSEDAFLAKYSSDGTLAWTKLLGTNQQDRSHSVAIANDGSIYITGFTHGDLGRDEEDNININAGKHDVFLAKYSSDDGALVWTKLLGTSGNDKSYGVSTVSDGSIYITGYLDGGGQDVFLAKYSSDGALAWTKSFGTNKNDMSHSIATSNDGSIYITGFTHGDLGRDEKDNININAGSRDVFLTKYSSDGTLAWTKLLGTEFSDEGNDIATANDGSIFITGTTNGDLGGNNNNGGKDIFVSKYTSDGILVWTKLLGSAINDFSYGIETSSDGSIYITGYNLISNLYFPAFLTKLAHAFTGEFHTEWVQPYAAMQNIGLNSIKNNRDLVLAKAGECNNYGWVIGDTDYCIYSNANNTTAFVNGNNSYGSYDYTNFNSSINIEKTINDKWKAGIAYGVGSSNLDNYNFSLTTASLSSTNTHYSIYGVKKVNDKFTLKGMIGGSDFNYKGNRNYLLSSATSSYDTDGYTAEINGIWDIKKNIKNMKNPIRLKPTVGVAYAAHTQDGFSESGIGTLITLESNQSEQLLFKTGLAIDKQISMEGGKWLLVPSIALDYEMDIYAEDNHRGLEGGLTKGDGITTLVSAKTLGKHNGSIKVGADFVCTKNFMFNLNAEYSLAEGGDTQSYGGGFKWQF